MNVDGLPPLLSGPEALEPGPLWVSGKRRPVQNSFGFNPWSLRLEPAAAPTKPHDVNVKAAQFFNVDTFRARTTIERLHRLARRKRVGTQAEPVRRKQGVYEDVDLEPRDRDLRDDAAESLWRLLRFCALWADWRTGKIGQWRADPALGRNRIHFFTRCQIADRAGFPVRVDDSNGQLRVRAYQLDDRIEDAIVAGLLWRHRNERLGVWEFKLTPLFWHVVGVQKLRERYGQKERKKAVRAEAEAAAAEKAARRAEPRADAAAAQLVATLARKADATAAPQDARKTWWPSPDGRWPDER